MSAATWIDEFYPEPAEDVAREEALDHSIRKWSGLTLSALSAHDLDAAPIPINADTCALCIHYFPNGGFKCQGCPLFDVLGRPCYALDPNTDNGPFEAWTNYEDPGPMLEALLLAKQVQELREKWN